VQGIEEYKGKFIVYSLGNFMFGGNKNPSDKDTFVFQQTFYFQNGEQTEKKEIRIIPFCISSVTTRNNYQPMPLTGKEANRVKEKIISLSAKIKPPTWTAYEVK
jgi:poly-gamma-glutamate synthesis protein (capsule biosynthesis protein)